MKDCDVAAEKAVLLAVFHDPSLVQRMLEKRISTYSFGVMPYRAAWEAVLKLHLADQTIDALHLESELGQLWARVKPIWDEAQEKETEWEDFLRKLYAYQINRSVHHAFGKYQEWWEQDSMRVTQFLPTLGNMISGIGESTQDLDPRPGVIYASNTLETEGTPTGIASLTKMLIGGFRPGEFYVCSSPTKHGKTSLAATLTAYQVAKGNNVVVFSLEMSEFYFLCRVLCAMAHVGWKEAVAKKPKDAESEERLNTALEQAEQHLRIYPPTVQTPDEIDERLKWHLSEFDIISLSIVDHMGIVRSKKEMNNWAYDLERQAYALKAAAVKHGVPLWVFSQMSNKQAEEFIKSNDLKTMATRGSGGVAHAADFAFLMGRHGVNEAIIRKKLDRLTGQSAKAIIKHDPAFYLFYESVTMDEAYPEWQDETQ